MTVVGRGQSQTLNVVKTVLLDQSALQSVKAIHRTQGGGDSVSLQLTENGKQRFAQATREGKGQKLAIIIDGQVQAAPMIQAEISDGRVEISGNWTYEEADDLAARLMNASLSRKTPLLNHPRTTPQRNPKQRTPIVKPPRQPEVSIARSSLTCCCKQTVRRSCCSTLTSLQTSSLAG